MTTGPTVRPAARIPTLRQAATLSAIQHRHGIGRYVQRLAPRRGLAPTCPLIGAGTAGRMWRQRQCQRYPCCQAPTFGDSVHEIVRWLLVPLRTYSRSILP